jgi:hypothetical protein
MKATTDGKESKTLLSESAKKAYVGSKMWRLPLPSYYRFGDWLVNRVRYGPERRRGLPS